MLTLKEKYCGFHAMRLFFENYDSWRDFCGRTSYSFSMSKLEYDWFTRGTAADIYVPLWASASLSGTDILLNEITLEVIRRYKEFGYTVINMDGNPADYIGEQFRFLEYLAVCAIKGNQRFENAIEAFIDDFTADCLHSARKYAEAIDGSDEFLKVLQAGIMLCSGIGFPIDAENIAGSFDSFNWNENPPLPLEPEHFVTQASFNDCGGKCKMLSRVQEGCVLSISPDRTEMKFAGCPRGAAYRSTFLNSRRLRYPMERVGERGEGRFRRISWAEAVGKFTAMMNESHEAGPGCRFKMSGAGVVSVLSPADLMNRLLCADGGMLGYYGSYSLNCAAAVLPRMFGQLRVANKETEILNSKLIILWGNNLVTNHFGSAQKRVLMEAKEKGIPIIVIDPRQSDTAIAAASEWIPINPGTDAALVAAMCYVIKEQGLYDRDFIDRYCIGFDEEHMPDGIPEGESFFSYLDGIKDGVRKTPAWASQITGIPAERIEALAIEYAKADCACIMPGLSIQRQLNGEQNYRAVMTLPCLVGNLVKPGGGIVSWSHPAGPLPGFEPKKNPYNVTIQTFQWWRAVECPETMTVEKGLRGAEKLETSVKYLFCIGSGMLLNQHSDINHTLKILRTPGMVKGVVNSDLFMTPSARAADLLLPAPSFFEQDNICPPWGGEDYVIYNHASIPPLFECRFELGWMKEVAEKLGIAEDFCGTLRTDEDWLKLAWKNFREKVPTAYTYDEFKERSFQSFDHKIPTVTFSANVLDGIPFSTPSGKIEIFIKEFYDRHDPELYGVPGYVPVEEGVSDPERARFPFQLIAFHSKRHCHSIHDQNRFLDEIESPAVWINEKDASEIGIADGETVEIFNDRGCIRMKSYVSTRVCRGTVAMMEGSWFTPDESGTDTRGSINVLTMSHRATPFINGNPQHTNLVQIRKIV